jgi:hypothetical protein
MGGRAPRGEWAYGGSGQGRSERPQGGSGHRRQGGYRR